MSLLYPKMTRLIVTQAKEGILVKRGDYDTLASGAGATGDSRGVDVKKGTARREMEGFPQ